MKKIANFFSRNYSWLLVVAIFLLTVFLRWGRLTDNQGFWIDEFSTSIQGETMLNSDIRNELISQNAYHLEKNNFLTHFLVGGALSLLGREEWVARLPIFIASLLVPILAFLLVGEAFGKKDKKSLTISLVTAILLATSYFEITWSGYARGYMIQQCLSLGMFYCYFRALKNIKNWRWWLATVILGVLGILTHNLFIFVWLAVGVHFLIWGLDKKSRRALFTSRITWIVGGLFLLLMILIGLKLGVLQEVARNFEGGLTNMLQDNSWYYRAFLLRQYWMILGFFLVGVIYSLAKKRRETMAFILLMGVTLVFHCFFFGFRNTKYFLPIWPYYLMLVSVGLVQLGVWLSNWLVNYRIKVSYYWWVGVFLAFIFLMSGKKFILYPRDEYLPRRDLSDIPLFDYEAIYQIIKQKGKLEAGQTAIVETWSDRARWYLGIDYPAIYGLGYGETEATTDVGLSNYTLNEKGEKIAPNYFQMRYIITIDDLILAMNQYPCGFLWLDDYRHNRELIDYIEANLTEEAHQENEKTIWPGTLYSWGVD